MDDYHAFTMKYQEILDEYKQLLQAEVQLKQQLRAATKAAIAGREVIKQELEINRAEQNRIENTVQILDEDLARLLWHVKQCAVMDALPLTRRPQALSFAKAMTALEGTPAQPETEIDLQLWAAGEKSFADIHMKALSKYGIVKNL